MDQSVSGGSCNPPRMTLTLICSLRESSNMREIIACVDDAKLQDNLDAALHEK